MPRSLAQRLLDIKEAATDLRDFVAAMDSEAFHELPNADRMGYRAVKNALAELGEAAKAIPRDVRDRYPDVDWKGFAGLRDLVSHQYFGIDTRRLLPVIQHEVPRLLHAVAQELSRLQGP